MCWRHQLVKKGKSLKKDFWISSISVGVLIPCCVSRQCSACFPPLKSKSISCWENRLRLNENKNVATLKCITFCSEALFCKNNDLRALQAVNKRPHEFQSDLQNAFSFHTGGNFRALTFVWDCDSLYAHSILHLGLSPLSDHFEKNLSTSPQAPSVILILFKYFMLGSVSFHIA